jgi:hypothetical protein
MPGEMSIPVTTADAGERAKMASAKSPVPVPTSRACPPFGISARSSARRRHVRSLPTESSRFRRSYRGAMRSNIAAMRRSWSFERVTGPR